MRVEEMKKNTLNSYLELYTRTFWLFPKRNVAHGRKDDPACGGDTDAVSRFVFFTKFNDYTTQQK